MRETNKHECFSETPIITIKVKAKAKTSVLINPNMENNKNLSKT